MAFFVDMYTSRHIWKALGYAGYVIPKAWKNRGLTPVRWNQFWGYPKWKESAYTNTGKIWLPVPKGALVIEYRIADIRHITLDNGGNYFRKSGWENNICIDYDSRKPITQAYWDQMKPESDRLLNEWKAKVADVEDFKQWKVDPPCQTFYLILEQSEETPDEEDQKDDEWEKDLEVEDDLERVYDLEVEEETPEYKPIELGQFFDFDIKSFLIGLVIIGAVMYFAFGRKKV